MNPEQKREQELKPKVNSHHSTVLTPQTTKTTNLSFPTMSNHPKSVYNTYYWPPNEHPDVYQRRLSKMSSPTFLLQTEIERLKRDFNEELKSKDKLIHDLGTKLREAQKLIAQLSHYVATNSIFKNDI